MTGAVEADTMRRLLRREKLDTLDGAFAYAGGTDLDKPGLGHRRRTRVVLTDDDGAEHVAFLKRYAAEPLCRRLGRRLTGRPGPARAEQRNIEAVRAAGVNTMHALACDEDTGLLGPRRGFLVASAVPGESLERGGGQTLLRRLDDTPWVERFTSALSQTAAKLHAAGLFHRDFYACHIFLDNADEEPRLYLIDLARVFRPCCRRFRWRVKDLAQLLYSMPPAWTDDWWGAFLNRYAQTQPGVNASRLARAIAAKAEAIRRQVARR